MKHIESQIQAIREETLEDELYENFWSSETLSMWEPYWHIFRPICIESTEWMLKMIFGMYQESNIVPTTKYI